MSLPSHPLAYVQSRHLYTQVVLHGVMDRYHLTGQIGADLAAGDILVVLKVFPQTQLAGVMGVWGDSFRIPSDLSPDECGKVFETQLKVRGYKC